MTDLRKGLLLSASTSLIFGFSFLFTKSITGTVSVLSLLGWRFLLAFLSFFVISKVFSLPINIVFKESKPLFIIGFLVPILYFSFENLGIKYTTASESGVIISTIPILIMILSSLLLKEYPRKKQMVGIVLSTFGVILMVLTKSGQAEFSLTGYLMLFGAVATYSFYAILQRKLTTFNPYEKTFMMMLCGALFFFPLALGESLLEGDLEVFLLLPLKNRDFLISLLYLSLLSSNIAFLMSATSIGLVGPTVAASFSGLSTLTTVVAGVLILGEVLYPLQWFAAALILMGVFIANKQ